MFRDFLIKERVPILLNSESQLLELLADNVVAPAEKMIKAAAREKLRQSHPA